MTLNKILALALSGVLAVGMLAGCGGGVFGGSRSTSIAKELNAVQDEVSYQAGDEKLKNAVADVARALTQNDLNNGPAEGATAKVMAATGYENMNLVQWSTQTTVGSRTFVKVFVYNTESGAYDTTAEVAAAVSRELAVMNLEATEDGGSVVNSYTGEVAAYNGSIGEGENAVDIVAVGVAITQTVTAVGE